MADELIMPLLGLNDDDEEDDTTDSEGIDDADGDDSEPVQNMRICYDTSLPTQHQYLGSDLNELSGRIVLDEASLVNLPLWTLPGIVLVPGQVLPLHLEHPSLVSMIKKIIDAERTFGLISSTNKKIGTTAEIRSFSEEDNDGEGLSVLRAKAEGRQRFEVRQTWRQPDGILMGKVRILPEIELTYPLRIPTHKNISKTLVPCTRWNLWVYQQYDPQILMNRIKSYLKNWMMSAPDSETHLQSAPSKPREFSYWVAANLPLDDGLRCELLSINCSIQRLRWELCLLQKNYHLNCADCKSKICHRDNIFSMSIGGPQGTYVNPSGYVHDLITVTTVTSIALMGQTSTEFSWFPGYAWTACRCHNCHNHMGWKFTATNKRLKPESFWGICRSAVDPILKVEDEVSLKLVL